MSNGFIRFDPGKISCGRLSFGTLAPDAWLFTVIDRALASELSKRPRRQQPLRIP